MARNSRTYAELIELNTFEDRFRYLALSGRVGEATFGTERHLNQRFYTSREWKQVRDHVMIRDNGCDLGVEGYDIHTQMHIHHINPMSAELLLHRDDSILDPDNLITTTLQTHNAIHYGDERQLPRSLIVERVAGDTKLW